MAATVTFGGQVMVGGVISRTTTLKVQLAVLPAASVVVSVSVVVLPIANGVPTAGVCVFVADEQLSIKERLPA